ncbi:MAG TPA: hypothetical protein VF053_10175 [Streptosporangiales bacterium]
MITFASLRDVRPGGLASAAHEYGTSATLLGKDAERYRDHIVRPVRSGHVWRGGGQSDAGVVTRVLALAFDTAAVRMHTVGSLLTTLHAELAAAKAALNRVVDEAEAAGYTVDAAGKITDPAGSGGMFACPSTGGIDVGQAHSDEKIAHWQARLKIAVARARRADASCSSGLTEVVGAEFVTATTAQPGLLKRAEDANVAAYGDYVRALLLPRVLATAHRADVTADEHTEHGPTDFWRDYAKGLWASTLGAVPDLAGLVWLINRAESGDPSAWSALATVPPALWHQLSTAAGWKSLLGVDDLEAGRPGAFAGKHTLLGRELFRSIAKKAAETAARHAVRDGAASAGRALTKRRPYELHASKALERRTHGKAGTFYRVATRPSVRGKYWMVRVTGGHGGHGEQSPAVFKVYKADDKGLHWQFDCDEYGDKIQAKHKSPTLTFIPWKDLH